MNNLLILLLLHLLMGLVCILLPNIITILTIRKLYYYQVSDDSFRTYSDYEYEDELFWNPKEKTRLIIKSLIIGIIYGVITFLYRWLISGNYELNHLFGFGLFAIFISVMLAFDLDYLSRLVPHLILFIIVLICTFVF